MRDFRNNLRIWGNEYSIEDLAKILSICSTLLNKGFLLNQVTIKLSQKEMLAIKMNIDLMAMMKKFKIFLKWNN